jgi:lysophospholipase L1-like esterase
MKKIILVLSLAVPFGALAQTTTNSPAATTTNAAPAAPAKPMLPEPLSATTPDNTRYLNKPGLTGGVTADLAKIQGKPCDIIFIGDSITAGWKGAGKAIWEKDYVPRHALDFGIGGDKTQNVLWRLDNMPVKDLKPKVAVILIGTNNFGTPEEIAAGVKAVVEKTQATFSGVKIILLTIMPNRRAEDKMMAANVIIKSYADDKSVFLLDLTPLMTPITTTGANGKPDTNYKGLSKDHLHPDASGYQIWADAMEPLLTKLLAGG